MAAAPGDNQAEGFRRQFAEGFLEQAVHGVVGVLQPPDARPSLELPHVYLGAHHLQSDGSVRGVGRYGHTVPSSSAGAWNASRSDVPLHTSRPPPCKPETQLRWSVNI